MRLIDADAVITVFEKLAKDKWNQNVAPASWADAYESLAEDIDSQPTAYSVEAVVRELEDAIKMHARHQLKCEEKGCEFTANRHEHKIRGLEEAIEIVKRGGRNDR